jgi:hypothetical protein
METQGDEIGLFSRPFVTSEGEFLGCIKYTAMDGMLKSARGFGIMASVLSSASVVIVTYSIVWRLNKLVWKIGFYFILATIFCQMMTYLALGSERCFSGCSLTGTGSLAVFNTMLLIGTAIATLQIVPSEQPWIKWYEVEEPRKDMKTENSCQNNSEDDRSDVSSTTSTIREDRPFFSIQKLTGFRIVTVGIIGITWIVSIVGLHRCTFLQAGPKDGTIVTRMGLFTQAIEIQGEFFGCVTYPERVKEEFDSSFKTARAFGTIEVFLLTILLLVEIMQLFVKRIVEFSWYTMRALMTAATASQLIVFCIFDTEICKMDDLSECRLGGIGIVTVLNVLFMVTITIMAFAIPPASVPILQINRTMGVQRIHIQKDKRLQEHELKRNHERILRHQSPLRDDSETSDSHKANTWKDTRGSLDKPVQSREKLIVRDEESQEDNYDNVESITFQVDYINNNQKRMTKTVLHCDGTRFVTTSIETLSAVDDDFHVNEGFSDDASSIGKGIWDEQSEAFTEN